MRYQAIALNDDLPGGRLAVEIDTTYTSVEFVLNDQKLSWEIQNLLIEQGGSGDQLIYIKNKTNPSITLYTRDKSVLKDEFLNRLISYNLSAKKIKGNFNKARLTISIIVLIIVGIPLSFFVFRSFFVKKIANNIPVSWEVEAGDKLFGALKTEYNIVDDEEISAKFDSLFTPLTEVAKYDSVQFKFYLCNDPSLNAFALPGGHVVINSGTIQKIERIEELYGVLGHELAHVTERHHIRGLIGNLGTFLIFQGAFGNEAGILGSLGESAGSLSSLFYSREFERESDSKGYEYLKSAQIDPHGMIEFFERIQKEQEELLGDTGTEAMESLNSFVSTHPGTIERIESLQQKLDKDDIEYSKVDFDVQKLKKFINQKLEE